MLFESIEKQNPSAIALQDDAKTIVYGDLIAAISEKEQHLNGVRVLAIMLDNCVDWILWDLAALRQGIPCVPIPAFFTPAQVQHALITAGASHAVSPAGLQKTDLPPIPLPEGTIKITFTSGTTGTPKGVCLSQESMMNVAGGISSLLDHNFAKFYQSVLPLGVLLENIAGVYTALMAGGCVCLTPICNFGADYRFLHESLKNNSATSLILVPEILRILMMQVANKGPLPSLQFIAVGGSKLDPALIQTARHLGLPVYEGYGLSECASVVSLNTPMDDNSGSVGRCLPHIKLNIADDGEILITSPGFLGYIGDTQPDIFATGDLGSIENGYLKITGRKKNVLITSYGRNISPEWIESALTAQPEIAQAFVYGDSQPYLSALLVPAYKDANVDDAVARVNKSHPDYAHIKEHTIVPSFTIQNGLLTGSGRPRRYAIYAYYNEFIKKEKTMSFYERLVKETQQARQELYNVPQLRDGIMGSISRETYVSYLTEAYHHVSHTVRFLMSMGTRLPESKKFLHHAIAEYVEEEVGHEEWILNDIEAAGGNKEQARMSTPNLETQVLVAYNYDYIARKNPVGFMGMVFMLESTSTQIANKGADAVKNKLNLPKNAFSYLYSHGELDISHMKFFEETVNKITDPDDQASIIEVANNTFRLFANVLRSIPHDMQVKNAA
jgi:long-subunit acyl-CoA synthetase (AMP-forming)/pyrroloquinoline quinone (PQQ) biosynthesis protein C